jgi:DNA-binding response OmpR family regulator
MLLAPTAGMPTVMVVDDEPNIIELVRITLEDDRVRIVVAADGEEALTVAHLERPDLILLDVNLPDLSGLEVCRRLRAEARTQDTKIVMLTAAAQRDDVERGRAAGADDYLTKPFSPVRLLNLVDTLVPEASLWARP